MREREREAMVSGGWRGSMKRLFRPMVRAIKCALGRHHWVKTSRVVEILPTSICVNPLAHCHKLWLCDRCPARAVRIAKKKFVVLGPEHQYGT